MTIGWTRLSETARFRAPAQRVKELAESMFRASDGACRQFRPDHLSIALSRQNGGWGNEPCDVCRRALINHYARMWSEAAMEIRAALESAASHDAVDPVSGVSEDRPRAHESDSSSPPPDDRVRVPEPDQDEVR
jgi:hypothetical protein